MATKTSIKIILVDLFFKWKLENKIEEHEIVFNMCDTVMVDEDFIPWIKEYDEYQYNVLIGWNKLKHINVFNDLFEKYCENSNKAENLREQIEHNF